MVGELSQIEFNASTTSTGTLRRLMKKHGMMNNPLFIRGISPDRHFDWKKIHYLKANKKTKNNKTDYKKRNQNNTSPEDLPITIKNFAKFKVRVLTDRRMCFAGTMLRGIRMPKNRFYQIWIMKCFMAWYSSCIQIGEDDFKVDMTCFAERENRFLKFFLKSLEHFWKMMPMKDLFYKLYL